VVFPDEFGRDRVPGATLDGLLDRPRGTGGRGAFHVAPDIFAVADLDDYRGGPAGDLPVRDAGYGDGAFCGIARDFVRNRYQRPASAGDTGIDADRPAGGAGFDHRHASELGSELLE